MVRETLSEAPSGFVYAGGPVRLVVTKGGGEWWIADGGTGTGAADAAGVEDEDDSGIWPPHSPSDDDSECCASEEGRSDESEAGADLDGDADDALSAAANGDSDA